MTGAFFRCCKLSTCRFRGRRAAVHYIQAGITNAFRRGEGRHEPGTSQGPGQEGLSEIRGKLKPETRNFIDGKFVAAKKGKTFETINPATGAVIATVTRSDAGGSMRAVVPLGTPVGPGDTVYVGERWF